MSDHHVIPISDEFQSTSAVCCNVRHVYHMTPGTVCPELIEGVVVLEKRQTPVEQVVQAVRRVTRMKAGEPACRVLPGREIADVAQPRALDALEKKPVSARAVVRDRREADGDAEPAAGKSGLVEGDLPPRVVDARRADFGRVRRKRGRAEVL